MCGLLNIARKWAALHDYNLITLARDSPPPIVEDIMTEPEFTPSTIMPALVISTVIATEICRRRKQA